MTYRRSWIRSVAIATLCGFAATSCGEVARTGRGPVVLVIDTLTGASGAKPGDEGATLESDVLTFVQTNVNGQQVRVPTIFEDKGAIQMHTVLKDPGTPGFVAVPTQIQEVTLNRYRVVFRRADGRNTPGVDVPYPFDGAVTFTVGSDGGNAAFILVRVQAKMEAPLKALQGGGAANVISTIADITFYGRDQAGNEYAVTGSISVNFSDWGDPS
jgi:hypothetical protein